MQTLNGHCVRNDADSYLPDVGAWRRAIGNWNFTDDGGATGTYTLFTVTGNVYLHGFFATCATTCTIAVGATAEVGITGNTAELIAQTAGDAITEGLTWQDATPEANPAPVILLAHSFSLAAGADIIMTIGTDAFTAGSIDFYCLWLPMSNDGAVIGL